MNNIVDQAKVAVKQQQLTLEDLISIGVELRQKRDNVNWGLGDLAIEVSDTLGSKILRQVAQGIGIPISTLRRYRDVSRSYPDQRLREEFAALSWSHFKVLSARDDRHLWLVRAHDENISVERLKVLISPDQSKVIDDQKIVPPKPEMAFCMRHRKWYIVYPGDTCPAGCDHKEIKKESKND